MNFDPRHFVRPLSLLIALAGCAPPTPPPSVYDDASLAAQIADGDGIDGTAPLFQAWVNGRETRYWILDGAVPNAMPLYRLCRREGDDDCVPVDHPPIVDALPGDADYSPFGQVHWVLLPEGWDGQLTSVAEANAAALRPPEPSSFLMHCPIAAPDAGMDVGDGVVLNPETPIYVRGMEARCFDFSATRDNRAVLPSGALFERHVYLLTREGEAEPLSEPARMTDLNGDGDQLDSNNVFGVGLEDIDYTPLWKLVRVTVPAGLPSIETTPAYTDAADMFDVAPDYTISPRAGQIVDYEITSTLINCPLQSAPGRL